MGWREAEMESDMEAGEKVTKGALKGNLLDGG